MVSSNTNPEDSNLTTKRKYYDNGQLYYEENFNSQRLEEGIQRAWYDDGQLWYEETYANGVFQERIVHNIRH